ncbi:MAG: hypothetical protein GYB42_04970 [Alphaproteobacteria bacterium]|nr:hypothetical protein [Alphaproteobacteria bacterium]
MRFAFVCLFLSAFIPSADATPVSIQDAADELSKRGAESIQVALLAGTPQIKARLDDQSMALRLMECDPRDYTCNVTSFVSCREYISMTSKQASNITNNYSKQATARGSAYVADEPLLGQTLCVRLRAQLHAEDIFDLSDVFDWQLTMRDFFEFADNQVQELKVQDVVNYQ